MIKEPTDDVPEIHMNRDKDRYFTMLLLKIHESDSEPATKECSKFSGMNCCILPVHCSQNNSGKVSYMHQASGDKIFMSSDSLFNNCDQQKHSKCKDANVVEHLDYSLPGDACINRKTFAYQPANGCYSEHKKAVQVQRKRRTNRHTINKTIQDIEEEQNLQLLLEFRRYLSQLVPSEKLDSAEDTANRNESSRQPEAEKPKKSSIQKSLSASAFGDHRQMKHSLPSVQTKPSNVVPSRPSSFHSVLSTSGVSKPRQAKDCFEHDMHCNVQDDFWSLHGDNDTRTKRAAGKNDRIKSHGDIEIMQKIKDMHQTLMHGGGLPNLGSATKLDEMSDGSLIVTGSTDSKPSQLTRNYGRNSVAWLNSKTGDFLGSQVAFANDNDCFSGSIAMPQFPTRKNPYTYKPRVPHHVVALATGSCLAHQPTSSKPSLHGLEMIVQSLNPVVKSGNHLSYPSTGDNRSKAEANSGIQPLEGKKIKNRRPKHRIL